MTTKSVLIYLIVTAVWFVITVAVGFRLERSPKPYRLLLLSAHIVLFVFIAFGVAKCLSEIGAVTGGKFFSMISLYVAVVTLAASLVTGAVMTIKRQKSSGWIVAHKLAMLVMAISIVSGIVLMFIGI